MTQLPPLTPKKRWRESRTSEFSPSSRGRMLSLLERGYTRNQVAAHMDAAWKTIDRTVKRHIAHGTRNSLRRLHASSTLTQRQQNIALRIVRRDRWAAWHVHAAALHRDYGIQISADALRKLCTTHDLKRRRAKRKMHLSPKNVQDRRRWLRLYANADWTQWLFTGECSTQVGQHGPQWVTCEPHERYAKHCIAPQVSGARSSVMWWAAVGVGFKSELVFAYSATHDAAGTYLRYQAKGKAGRPGFNSAAYAELMRRSLLPAVERMRELHGHCMVVEDGAPPHKGNVAKAVRQEAAFEQVQHPGTSPDLNVIETVWLRLKQALAARAAETRTVADMCAVAQQEWANIPQEWIDTKIMQMPERVKELQSANGWYTSY